MVASEVSQKSETTPVGIIDVRSVSEEIIS